MPLEELELLIPGLDFNPTEEQLELLYERFRTDFIDNICTVDGANIIVKEQSSRVRDYEDFGETFVHVITRESKLKRQRNFDPDRANRIHWIRPILENSDAPEIRYFEYEEGDRSIKKYYWYEDQNFLVILKPISKNLLLVTSFYIDNNETRRYRKRWQDFHFKIKKMPHLR